MKVLLVAPSQASLPQSTAEVDAVVNSGLLVRLLQSSVSQRDLVGELSTPGKYDVLWLATHGNSDGVVLTNETLSSSAIVALVRGSGVKLVFLNTCSSVATASAIQNEANVDVICTITDVPDLEAYRTGALFASHLVRTGNFRKSYEASKPGRNSTYIYLSSSGPLQNGQSDFGKLHSQVDELEQAARARDEASVLAKAAECNRTLQEIKDNSIAITELRTRVSAIELHINPPLATQALRIFAGILVVIGFLIYWRAEDRIFGSLLWVGITLEALLVLSVVMILVLADAIKERRK